MAGKSRRCTANTNDTDLPERRVISIGKLTIDLKCLFQCDLGGFAISERSENGFSMERIRFELGDPGPNTSFGERNPIPDRKIVSRHSYAAPPSVLITRNNGECRRGVPNPRQAEEDGQQEETEDAAHTLKLARSKDAV